MPSSLLPEASFTPNLFPLLACFSSIWDIYFSKSSTFAFLPPPACPSCSSSWTLVHHLALILLHLILPPTPALLSSWPTNFCLFLTFLQPCFTKTSSTSLLLCPSSLSSPTPSSSSCWVKHIFPLHILFFLNRKRKSQMWFWQVFKKSWTQAAPTTQVWWWGQKMRTHPLKCSNPTLNDKRNEELIF